MPLMLFLQDLLYGTCNPESIPLLRLGRPPEISRVRGWLLKAPALSAPSHSKSSDSLKAWTMGFQSLPLATTVRIGPRTVPSWMLELAMVPYSMYLVEGSEMPRRFIGLGSGLPRPTEYRDVSKVATVSHCAIPITPRPGDRHYGCYLPVLSGPYIQSH